MQHNSSQNYNKISLRDSIRISKLVTIHYFEFAKNYLFPGEKHDFWEFLYVDKGEVEVLADSKGFKLHQGDVIFHKPNEFHSVWANGKIAPNVMVISFVSNSKDMSFFENKLFSLSTSSIELLGKILEEGKFTFSTNLNGPYKELVKKNTNDVFASEQLIKLYLELFLINLIRDNDSTKAPYRISKTVKKRMENDLVDEVISYLEQHIYTPINFNDICSYFYIGKTHLKTIFKTKTNQGVMSYYQTLRIEEAKKLIREGHHNFTQISELLKYDSVHYFSKCFKKATNMTPSEYALSLKARMKIQIK